MPVGDVTSPGMIRFFARCAHRYWQDATVVSDSPYLCFRTVTKIAVAAASPTASITKSPFADGQRRVTKMRATMDSIHSTALVRAAVDSVRDPTSLPALIVTPVVPED